MTLRLQTTLYQRPSWPADPHHARPSVIDRQRIKTFTVGGKAVKPPVCKLCGTLTWNPEWESVPRKQRRFRVSEVRVAREVPAHTTSAFSFVKQSWEPEDVSQPPRTAGIWHRRDVRCQSGPRVGDHRRTIQQRGPGETEPRRIFSCRPRQERLEEPCAKTILTTLARRAYRRPITDADARTLLTFPNGAAATVVRRGD